MRELTSADAEILARRAAAALRARGLRTGDRVALVLPGPAPHTDHAARDRAADQQRQVLALAYGALRAGIVPVMVNPALTTTEREDVLGDADAQIVVDDPAFLSALVSGEDGEAEISEVPLARAMHYTSGTTGRSKGVWSGLLTEDDAWALMRDETDEWHITAEDTLLTHGPLAHSAPLRFAIATLVMGGRVLLPGWFDADEIARTLVDERPTIAFTVPSHLQRLFALAEVPESTYRLLIHAGSACPPTLKRRIHDWAGVERVAEFYGATEGQFSVCPGVAWEERPGTVGRARSGRMLHIDDGVIWCTPPTWGRFSYWRDADKTARSWRQGADGREQFTVGDLGRLDADGYLWLDGRRDDLIITGGVNVYPDDVEAVLLACPGVEQVAVFGLEDEQWGQRVCAAIVGAVSDADLSAWSRERLATYKRPKNYYRVADLPRTDSGKVRRLALPGVLGLE